MSSKRTALQLEGPAQAQPPITRSKTQRSSSIILDAAGASVEDAAALEAAMMALLRSRKPGATC
jgi:hypothetical protein